MPPLQLEFETIPLLALSSKLRNHVIEMKKRRRVTFHDHASVKLIPIIPTEYSKDIWMTKPDFRRIRQQCARDIIQAEVDGGESMVELRGLETSASDNHFVRSYESRKEAVAAVLEEQKFQRQTGYNYPEDIAAASKEVSAQSIANAILIAEEDMVAAR